MISAGTQSLTGGAFNTQDTSQSFDYVSFGTALVDFSLATGEAITGFSIMLSSAVTGPGAPIPFSAGVGLTTIGVIGMTNNTLKIQDILYDTNTSGLFEWVGGSLFGDEGEKVGQAIDMWTGFRPTAAAAGRVEDLWDVYELVKGGNDLENSFGN